MAGYQETRIRTHDAGNPSLVGYRLFLYNVRVYPQDPKVSAMSRTCAQQHALLYNVHMLWEGEKAIFLYFILLQPRNRYCKSSTPAFFPRGEMFLTKILSPW